jgi:hypothetical protein
LILMATSSLLFSNPFNCPTSEKFLRTWILSTAPAVCSSTLI